MIRADRAVQLAELSRRDRLLVPGTFTPAERAWVLCRHLSAASARLHSRASAGGRLIVGERQTAEAVAHADRALRHIEPLLDPSRRAALSAALTPAVLSLDTQRQMFATVVLGRAPARMP